MKSVKGEIPIENFYTSGIAGEIFFKSLKQGELIGTRCSKCSVTYFPPRLFCERCMAKLEESVNLPETGTLVSFSECFNDCDSNRLDIPVTVGLIKIDGADTVLPHKLNIEKPVIGMKVQAVFEKEKKGSILDIKHFAKA